MKKKIKLGTRGSALALWQANTVKQQILSEYPDIEIEIVKIKTTGDKLKDAPLAKIGGKGLFLKEIEEALLAKTIDLAVHSLKDVPVLMPKDLELYATLKREKANDAFISHNYKSLHELPDKAVIGTSSIRRKVQLLKHNKNLIIKDLRGNVPTRLKKLNQHQYDAIILATAGLIRLNLAEVITEELDYDLMIPAICQGIIGIEVRQDASDIKNIIGHLDDKDSHIMSTAERSFLKTMGGSCQTPMGGICNIVNAKRINLKAFLSSTNGSTFITEEKEGPIERAEELGESLGQELLDKGGYEIIRDFAK
jgi:hydroxymethylbilane synthase